MLAERPSLMKTAHCVKEQQQKTTTKLHLLLCNAHSRNNNDSVEILATNHQRSCPMQVSDSLHINLHAHVRHSGHCTFNMCM